MEFDELKFKIESAGVIGAGGAGFPTQCKLTHGIDTVVVNAAECEPLLYTDYVILKRHIDQVLEGAQAAREAMGAAQVVVGMKEHTAKRLGFSDGDKPDGRSIVKVMPNVYPMGDEVILIYQTLGRVVPPGNLPSAVGVVVMNVETAYNVANAIHGIPVTQKWVTIGGDVPEPKVYRMPINCSVRNVLEAAGVNVPEGDVVLDGGPAMGNVINPNTAIVTKRTKSLIILPDDIPAVLFKTASPERFIKRTSSACCQCYHCTDICPRHLLGYPLTPHITLRSSVDADDALEGLVTASLCSQCGICTLMACCQDVAPSVVMGEVKKKLREKHLGYRADHAESVNPERDNRLVQVDAFRRRIGVERFDRVAEFGGDLDVKQRTYRLPLSQHTGKPSVPIVQAGAHVSAGDMIGQSAGGISAALHAPVSGTVTAVTDTAIEITTASEGN